MNLIAKGIAARIWCDPDMTNIPMDVEAAEKIAAIIAEVLAKTSYFVPQSAAGW